MSRIEPWLLLPFQSDHWHSIERFSSVLLNAQALNSNDIKIQSYRPPETWKYFSSFLARRVLYTFVAPSVPGKVLHIVDSSYAHLRQFQSADAKILITCHDLEFWYKRNFKNQWIRRWMLENLLKANHITTPSEIVRSELSELARSLGRKLPPVTVIPNACGEEFVPAKDRKPLRRKLGLPEARHLLLNIANTHWPRKNFSFLLSVLENLRTRHPDILLLQVGPPFTDDIRNQIKVKNLNDVILRYENLSQEQIVGFYQAADIYLHPSTYEGFGYPLLEASACGTPFLATDIPVFRELFPGDDYLLSLDTKNWVLAIEKLIEQPEFQKRLLSTQAESKQKYTLDSQISAFKNLYEELAKN